MDGPVYITCAKILDQMPSGEGAYPVYKAGGVGHNFVSFDVTSVYGKGFKFHVEIYGYEQSKNDVQKNEVDRIPRKITGRKQI